MNTYLALALLFIAGSALLFLVLGVLALGWRYLPLSQRSSELGFTALAVVFCTPVPVSVGVGAMCYPIAVLYMNKAQLKWHMAWYASSPELVLPSILLTGVIAFLLSHKLLPNKSAYAIATNT